MTGIFKHRIISPKRGVYINMKKSDSGCMFCDLVKNIPEKLPSVINCNGVTSYIIKNYKTHVLVVNPFPYSPRGHLEIASKRHIEKFQDLTKEEFAEMQEVINESLEALDKAYGAESFNIGINLGKLSGGSHVHFHLHIVPRFAAEAGFLEATSSTRLIVEEPEQTMRKVAENLK